MAARMIYTQYARKHDKVGLSNATNATPAYRNIVVPGSAMERTVSSNLDEKTEGYDEKNDETYAEGFDEKAMIKTDVVEDAPAHIEVSDPVATNRVAVFPQYIAHRPTILTIREQGLPSFEGSFTVSDGATALFNIEHIVPSFKHRQEVRDAITGELVMTVRRNVGTIPLSYLFEDPCRKRIVDVQGQYFFPGTGSKSEVFFINAETGTKVELLMRGNYRNRRAEIINSATGEVLVVIESNLWEARNVFGGRRTYTVTVKEGVDLALISGLVTALDARAE